MMKYILRYSVVVFFVFGICLAPRAEQLQCRSYTITDSVFDGPEKFGKGLLWKIERDGISPSYIFGTMHIGDKDTDDIARMVKLSLDESKIFVMEALPNPEDMLALSILMFNIDGSRLDTMIPKFIFDKTTEILNQYRVPEAVVARMKPWAAYITMSYPSGSDTILDLKLLEMAQLNGAELIGLESLQEQISIFNTMEQDDQLRILMDTVCHYDVVQRDFEVMKSMYIQRDLKGMYVYGQRYSFGEDALYEELTQKLISERNRTMVERLEQTMEMGNVFIAIGAMHLPGEVGVLNLLEQQNYKLKRLY